MWKSNCEDPGMMKILNSEKTFSVNSDVNITLIESQQLVIGMSAAHNKKN